ncbi:MAG TPA: HEAT repeat domain-containing protein [Myxococcales bacterium]|jgi:HEAT repeat protein
MEAFAWLFILTLGAVFGVAFAVRHFKDRAANFGAAASGFSGGDGFGPIGTGAVAHRAFEGEVEGFDRYVETIERGSGDSRTTTTHFVLGGRGRIPPELTLVRESTWQGLRKAFGKDDVRLDEGEFDALVNVQGPEDVALAALGSQARKRVMDFIAAGGEVHSGDLKWPLRTPAGANVEELVAWMLPLARSLVAVSVPAALLANVAGDPNPKLRLRCLAALATGHAGAPETRQALEQGLADGDPEVRGLAAQHLEASPAVQQTLERLVEDLEAGEQVRASALERLSQLYPYPSIALLVRRAILEDVEPLRTVAVEAAGRGKDASLVVTLHNLVSTGDEARGLALARAFEQIGGAQAEEGLLALLQSSSDSVRREAAVGLGKIGTIRCVEPLLPLSGSVFGDAALKEAARDAVRAIQARLGDAGGGRLSVVDERAGEGGLSVESHAAERERG